MRSARNLAGATLFFVSIAAMGEPFYKFNGLHTDLSFSAAVAVAEGLGGVCQTSVASRRDDQQRASCEYLSCNASTGSGACEKPGASVPTIASQPILQITFDAPREPSSLARIIFLYEGSTEAVKESFKQAYGNPITSGEASLERNFSDTRRLNWKQGTYRLALLKSPQWIILTDN